MLRTTTTLVITALLLSLAACAPVELKQALENQRPRISVADQRVTSLDFERIALAFGLNVENPNPIGIQLAGLDYDLKLDGKHFLAGKQPQRMQIAAAGISRIEVPLSFALSEIQQALSNIGDKDEVPYELVTGLMIDVPLLGKLRYPVTTRGTIPVPRLPTVSLQSLSVERLDFSGATLGLKLAVDNPNAFSVALNSLNYDLKVNGKHWASGNQRDLGTMKQKQKSTITLPLTLNFMELGSGLYTMLNSSKPLDYQLSGKLNANSGHRLIGAFDMPINSAGRVNLSR